VSVLTRLAAPVRMSALGMYVPETVITNADLQRIVETSDEWILQRTGIRTRRRVAENQYTSDLCVRAVEDLLRNSPGAACWRDRSKYGTTDSSSSIVETSGSLTSEG